MEPLVVGIIKDRILTLKLEKPTEKTRHELITKQLTIESYDRLKTLGITDLGNLDFHDLKRISEQVADSVCRIWDSGRRGNPGNPVTEVITTYLLERFKLHISDIAIFLKDDHDREATKEYLRRISARSKLI